MQQAKYADVQRATQQRRDRRTSARREYALDSRVRGLGACRIKGRALHGNATPERLVRGGILTHVLVRASEHLAPARKRCGIARVSHVACRHEKAHGVTVLLRGVEPRAKVEEHLRRMVARARIR